MQHICITFVPDTFVTLGIWIRWCTITYLFVVKHVTEIFKFSASTIRVNMFYLTLFEPPWCHLIMAKTSLSCIFIIKFYWNLIQLGEKLKAIKIQWTKNLRNQWEMFTYIVPTFTFIPKNWSWKVTLQEIHVGKYC